MVFINEVQEMTRGHSIVPVALFYEPVGRSKASSGGGAGGYVWEKRWDPVEERWKLEPRRVKSSAGGGGTPLDFSSPQRAVGPLPNSTTAPTVTSGGTVVTPSGQVAQLTQPSAFGGGSGFFGNVSNFIKSHPTLSRVLAGTAAGSLGGLGPTGAEKALRQLSTSGFLSNQIQSFLPPSLRSGLTSPGLIAGVQQLLNLIMQPGGLSGNVAESIAPRVAMESERVARNFRGIGQNQAGAAARANTPVSISAALQSALDVAQERAQRDVRRGALAESEQLRREDLKQVYALLDAILQFTSSGRGQAIQGLASAAGIGENRRASTQAFFGNLFSNTAA